MEMKLKDIEQHLHSDSSINALQTLVKLKTDALNALSYELEYAKFEYNIINFFNFNDSSSARISANDAVKSQSNCPSDSHSDIFAIRQSNVFNNLLTYGTNEYTAVEHSWKHDLNESIKIIRDSLHKNSDKYISENDIDNIYDHISRIQNAYFQCVENREKNHKLWLRLKMYTGSRISMLNEFPVVVDGTIKNFGTGNRVDSTIHKSSDNKSRMCETDIKGEERHLNTIVGSTSNSASVVNEYKTVDNNVPSPTNLSPCTRGAHLISKDSNLSKLFMLINSTDEFKLAAKTIFQKYSNNLMPYNVFINVVEFLYKSVNLPHYKEIPVEKILKAYRISRDFHIDLRTFTLMYWEVLHMLKSTLELINNLIIDIIIDDRFLNYYHDESFVNIQERFNFVKKMSAGRSCTKYLVQELYTGQYRVVEFICKTIGMPKFNEISSEVENLVRLDHHNLVKYIDVMHDYNTVYLVSEYCNGLSLLNRLNQIAISGLDYTLKFVHTLFTQIIEALVYLNCNDMAHMCLTMDNIILMDTSDSPQIKLRDYCINRILNKDYKRSFFDSLFLSPESINGRSCKRGDIWSAGVILYFMLTGQMPHENTKSPDFKRNVKVTLSDSGVFECDDNIKDLIYRLLSLEINNRPTAFDVVKHPWYISTPRQNISGNSQCMVQGLMNLMELKNIEHKVVKIFESQSTFSVRSIKKITDTIKLATDTCDIDAEDLDRILVLENVSTNLANDIIKILSIQSNNICSVKCLKNACKIWMIGEINLLWSKFNKNCMEGDWSMDTSDFITMFSESKSLLVTKDKIDIVCNTISIDNKIYLNRFVELFY